MFLRACDARFCVIAAENESAIYAKVSYHEKLVLQWDPPASNNSLIFRIHSHVSEGRSVIVRNQHHLLP